VLATQCLLQTKSKTMLLRVDGVLGKGVTAKDLALAIIARIGTAGGTGYAIEFAGSAIRGLSMEGRMTLCNMAIEGGARVGYVNPDRTTVEFLRGRPYAPRPEEFKAAESWWLSMASDRDAVFADAFDLDAGALEPQVAWGINPGQTVGVTEILPRPEQSKTDKAGLEEAYKFTSFVPGAPVQEVKIDVAFIGSCTNGRMSDLREAARVAKGRRVAKGVRAIVVPGSQKVQREAEAEGLPEVFRAAGFEWRNAGCSMCLAMNPDKLKGREICASSSNRNFIGRQGSPTGRTLLMSPAMVAAAAVQGRVTDVREML